MTTEQVLSHITAISCFVSVLGWKKCVSPPIALLRWKPCWFGSLIDITNYNGTPWQRQLEYPAMEQVVALAAPSSR